MILMPLLLANKLFSRIWPAWSCKATTLLEGTPGGTKSHNLLSGWQLGVTLTGLTVADFKCVCMCN